MIYANLEARGACRANYSVTAVFLQRFLSAAWPEHKPFPTENTKMVINLLGNHTEKKYSQLLKLAVSRLQGYSERSSYKNEFTACPFKTRIVDCKLGLKRGLET